MNAVKDGSNYVPIRLKVNGIKNDSFLRTKYDTESLRLLIDKGVCIGKFFDLFIYNEQLRHIQNTHLYQDGDVLLYTSYHTLELNLPENLRCFPHLCLFFYPLNRAV